MPFATGKVFALHADGSIAHILDTYKVTDGGRLMLFPAGTNDLRLDVHSGQLNVATDTVATRFVGINTTVAKNTGTGILNFSLAGTGPMAAVIQQETRIVSGDTLIQFGTPQPIVFIPD
jgi:hypothetical protein